MKLEDEFHNIRNETEGGHPMDIKSITKEYCEQLYTHKFDKLDETDQFIKNHTKTYIEEK